MSLAETANMNTSIPSPPSTLAQPVGDLLTCQWMSCTAPHHPSPEALYEHVCETHIGRKSTNNLNLQCFWGACRTTTVKRDHITSHIRVHVPLKPHKCDFCGKSFKRPQDLKKHVKTHADESVLFNSPQTNTNNGRNPPNGYQAPTNGKHGSYADGSNNQHLNYPYSNATNGFNGANGFNGGNPMAGTNFAPLYAYGGPQATSYGGAGLTESRKRTHDALNDFFGQAKRRNIDAGQYQDLGAQFSQFLQMFAPMAAAGAWGGGYNPAFGGGAGGFDNSGMTNSGMAYQTQHAPPMNAYNSHFPELRTKNDLMSIDQFLEQLQNTVYDNPADVLPANYQPVAGMSHGGFQFPRRASNSPPRFHAGPQSAATPGSYSNNSFAQSSTLEDTPALTPSSFATGQSPQTSNRNLSPNSRPAGGSLYPTLPSFSSLDTQSNAFGTSHTSAPPSGLGPQYDDFDGRRRYSGGHLQRARQSPPARENSEKEAAEDPAEKELKLAISEGIKDVNISSPQSQNVKLPGVSEITRTEPEEGERKEGEEAKSDSKHESWLQNVKTIEALREYVRMRLQKGEFEQDSESEEDGNRTPRAHQAEQEDVDMKVTEGEEETEEQATTPKREGASLYPMLRPVEA